MGKEVVLSGKGVSIGYGNHCVQRHLSFSLRRGELTSLLGANGAGKSTLMQTLATLLPRLEGHISLFGKEVSEYTERELSRNIGIVLTERATVGGLTVCELVALGRQPHTSFFGRLRSGDKTLVESAIQSVGLAEKSHSYMAELSDGERQKAMIAKALVQECPIILLDEPTAFLDAPSRIETTQLLRRIATTQKRAILLSTHDIDLAIRLSDRLWLLSHDGLACGSPEDLILNHRIQSLFDNGKVAFDEGRGAFVPRKDHCQRIFAKADEETLLRWGWNALNRMGYCQGESEEECQTTITFHSKNKIAVTNKGESHTCSSFEEMEDWIEEMDTPQIGHCNV